MPQIIQISDFPMFCKTSRALIGGLWQKRGSFIILCRITGWEIIRIRVWLRVWIKDTMMEGDAHAHGLGRRRPSKMGAHNTTPTRRVLARLDLQAFLLLHAGDVPLVGPSSVAVIGSLLEVACDWCMYFGFGFAIINAGALYRVSYYLIYVYEYSRILVLFPFNCA